MRNRQNTMEELLAEDDSDTIVFGNTQNRANCCGTIGQTSRRERQNHLLPSPSKRPHRSTWQHHAFRRKYLMWCCNRAVEIASKILVQILRFLSLIWEALGNAVFAFFSSKKSYQEISTSRLLRRLGSRFGAGWHVRDQETQPCSSDSNASGEDTEMLCMESGEWDCSSPECQQQWTPEQKPWQNWSEQLKQPLRLEIPSANTASSPQGLYKEGMSPMVLPLASPFSPRSVRLTSIGSASPTRTPRFTPRAAAIASGFGSKDAGNFSSRGQDKGAKRSVLWGAAGSQCSLCGYTLEDGQDVITTLSCADGIKHHTTCFNESGVVFEDTDGAQIFGCDCGQFHPGVGLTEGVYALKADPTTPVISARCSPRADGRGRWDSGGSVLSSLAVEACAHFQQVDPAALAILHGKFSLRPALVGRDSKSMRLMELDPNSLAVRFSRQDVLSRAEAGVILSQGTAVLGAESNVLELKGETVVVGDLHGQFFDMLNILTTCGQPPLQQYLFLGDYVDRGSFSCEVALYLIALKVTFPEKVYLLRGNHETANQTETCGFKKECCAKYGSEIYDNFLECFSALPVCAILTQQPQQKSLFCVHGGISPNLRTMDDIRSLNRRVEPEDGTLLADLLWSDPSDDESVVKMKECKASPDKASFIPDSPPKKPTSPGAEMRQVMGDCTNGQCSPRQASLEKLAGFERNLVRGCSWSYDLKAVNVFLEESCFRGMLRAHSVQGEGFHQHFQDEAGVSCRQPGNGRLASPAMGEGVATVFSAPMYSSHHNRGGVLVVRADGSVEAIAYDATQEPAVMNSAQAAVRGACPFMPASLAEWAKLESETRLLETSRREKLMGVDTFTEHESWALRVLWEAMAGGGDLITEQSLFAFDDVFGDGLSCLLAGSVLKALSPNGQAQPASAGDLLLIARALKVAREGGL